MLERKQHGKSNWLILLSNSWLFSVIKSGLDLDLSFNLFPRSEPSWRWGWNRGCWLFLLLSYLPPWAWSSLAHICLCVWFLFQFRTCLHFWDLLDLLSLMCLLRILRLLCLLGFLGLLGLLCFLCVLGPQSILGLMCLHLLFRAIRIRFRSRTIRLWADLIIRIVHIEGSAEERFTDLKIASRYINSKCDSFYLGQATQWDHVAALSFCILFRPLGHQLSVHGAARQNHLAGVGLSSHS